ncbi:MAG TPA: hypothetical protein VLS94_08355, partial [Fusibacter sp.]|nr:hypothetical protein [Fusibacter sp.]
GTLSVIDGIANTKNLVASINVVVAFPPDSPPDITRHPYNSDVLVGESTSFKVTYNAYPEPTFQWQISKNGGKRWTNIPGATSSVYNITEATIGMNGYLYRVILDNNIGEPITTSPGLLTVTNGFADLQISQVSTVFNDSNEILWEITVTNLGPDTAHGVVIKDPLASSTKFLNDTSSIEPIFKGKTIHYNVGSIDANDSVTVAIRVSIIRDVDKIKNTATVSTTNLDDNLTNNSIELVSNWCQVD